MKKQDEAVKPLLAALGGARQATPPLWLMRQAGRYLPEYRQIRQRAGSFLDLVYSPEWATEVTLQPIRRYQMDAAILFSDILVIPHALGQKLDFEEGRGPILEPVKDTAGLTRLNSAAIDETLAPVYETVSRVREGLKREGFDKTALIGFCGAPWTVACYMVEGGSSREFQNVKSWAYRDPDGFDALIETVTRASIHYLKRQIRAGAEAVKIFDSWAGVLDEDLFFRWVVEPARKITEAVRKDNPGIPVIAFPKGAGAQYLDFAQKSGVDCLAMDYQVPLQWAAENIPQDVVLQGNLDPFCLLAGGAALDRAIDRIKRDLANRAYIFNLGHGIIKDTPPEHVAHLVSRVRKVEK